MSSDDFNWPRPPQPCWPTWFVWLQESRAKRPQTERGGLGTQYQLCLLEGGGVSWMSSQYTFQEPRQKKTLHTKTEWERGAAWWSLIKLRFEGRKQTRTWREADERNQNTWTSTAGPVQLDQYTTHVKTGVVKMRSESETLIILSLNKLT